MANTTVDSLQIEVQATSAKAATEINRLTESLQRLQGVARQPGLEKISRQLQGMAKTPSMAAMEKELARLEKQAIKDGDALLALQEKLEELQRFKGIGNPLTIADTDSKIRETERQIRELSTIIDETDAKIRALRQSLWQKWPYLEIIAPQNLLTDIIHQENNSGEIIQAVREATFAAANRIVEAIQNQDTSVHLDGKQLMQTVERQQRQRGADIMPSIL